MSNGIYENYLEEWELSLTKASEIRELREKERVSGFTLIALACSGFLTFLALVALLLWTNKVILFLVIVNATPTLLLSFMFYRQHKEYMKYIDKIKFRIERELE